ncbi:uncharacterized protein LOC116339423 [Contarinia nasturtii]|uniref:uncharacterized protein LOC116339423 n=1 Tax=Contarinia nasturtii TaxID=265458 RepID=UPI0012D3AB28|nr:uncharacterized protein LOC116339423 [Contarinia nasturtii]
MSSIKIIALFIAMLAVVSIAVAETRRMRLLVENNTPYIMAKTNQTNRQVKFLVDTGAMSSVIAGDMLKSTAILYGEPITFLGNNNDGTEFSTNGMVDIVLPRDLGSLTLPVCVMNRNNLGGNDGILGLDIILRYYMTINIPSRYIQYFVSNTGPSGSKLTRLLSKVKT